MNIKGLEERRNDLKEQMEAMLDTAKAEERAMTTEEINKFDELEKDLEKSGYSLYVRNRVINFVENQVNCPTSQVNTEDEVFTCVDINADEVFDPENGVIRTKIYMQFETKDGRYFDVELTQENEAVKETDSGFLDGYYPGKRTFLNIELKNEGQI